MNTETRTTAQTRPQGNAMLSPNRPPHAGKKKPNPALLRLLRMAMLIAGGLILLFGLLLLILPMFRVQGIEVSGNSFYTTEQIKEIAGVREGDEVLAVDLQEVVDRILADCPHVDGVSVSMSFPFHIKITLVEKTDVMYTSYQEKYVSFDSNFRVLETIDRGENQFSPFLYVILPQVKSMQKGSTIRFADAEGDRSYIQTLYAAMEEREMLASVTEVDFSERFSVSYVLDGMCRVELGKVASLDAKLRMVDELLAQKGGSRATYAIIDVSNPQKATYRAVSEEEF